MEFSFYKNGKGANMTETNRTLTLSELINYIKLDNLSTLLSLKNVSEEDTKTFYIDNTIQTCKDLYLIYHNTKNPDDKKIYQEYKAQNFAKVTLAGTFRASQRLKKTITNFNNLICIDIDGFDKREDMLNALNIINNDKYTYLSFISPSDYGIKILVRVDCPTKDSVIKLEDFYFKSYDILSKYYLNKYKLITDPSASDISRLCYIPYDPNLFQNKTAEVFSTYSIIFEEFNSSLNKQKPTSSKRRTKINSNNGSILDILLDLCKQNKITFSYGEWLSLGFIIYNELNEDGLDMYKSFSEIDSSYNEKETEIKWESIKSLYDEERTPTVKRLAEILKFKGVVIDKAIMKENDLSYNDNDLPFLIGKIVGKCYKDEFKATSHILRDDKMIPLSMPIRNQVFIDIKKSYVNCNKHNFEIYFESEKNISYFNPVFDKLKSIRTSDISEFNKLYEYFDFLPTVKTDILKIKKWMLGVMSMIFNDGKHFDSMLIFLGRQDGGKTYFIREQMLRIFSDMNHLCEKFKYDEASNPDMQKMLARNVIVLDDESTFSKKEASTIKTILSSKDLQFVDKWEKDITNNRRISSFIGTTNQNDIYDDETGGKRFHVIDLGEHYLPGAIVSGTLMKKEFTLNWEMIWGYIYDLFLSGVRHTDIEYVNNNSSYQKYTVLEKMVSEYFEIYHTGNENSLRNFRDIRMDCHRIAEEQMYNIKMLIDSPRGLSSALKLIFGSSLEKIVSKDKKNTFYNVRIKPNVMNSKTFVVSTSGLEDIFNKIN